MAEQENAVGVNMIEMAEIWTTLLDTQAVQALTSGWMENNASQIQYVGGKKVKVPEMLVSGLGNYSRGTGAANRGKYAKGSVEVKYTDYELTADRSAEFAWDRHDVDESGFIVQAPQVMGVFQREEVIPEIDAFRYSKIAQLVIALGEAAYHSEDLTPDNILDRFLYEVRAMQNVTGVDTSNLIATMPFSVYALLEIAAKKAMMFMPQNFTAGGGLTFQLGAINGIPIMPVVEDRMKTEYTFHDGTSKLGFEPTATAKTINWIIAPLNIPIAISKTDSLKIFTPEVNQDGDDWVIQYRKYHDLWILKNQLNQIVLSVSTKAIAAPTGAAAAKGGAANKKDPTPTEG